MNKFEAHIILNQVREGILHPQSVVIKALITTGDIHGKLSSPDSSADSRGTDSLSPFVCHAGLQSVEGGKMSKLKTLTIPDHHKVQAKIILTEAIDEAPDTVIVLCFWRAESTFKIKVSTSSDRLMVLGALEEAKLKFQLDGFV